MPRQPTPINILDDLMPLGNGAAAIRQTLLWDYDQLGADADAVRQHAVEIKLSERRANDAVIDAGRHLIAVRDRLQHGQWQDWLSVEFKMSDRTARRMMAVAEQFDGKTDTVSVLGPSVLYLLAGDSVPEPAREAVIDLAKTGQTVTKAQAQTIIDQHKPAAAPRRYESGLPALDMPAPTAPAPAIVAADDRPLPQWVTAEPEPAPLTAADLHVMQPPPAATHEAVTRSQAAVAAYRADVPEAKPAADRVGKMVRLIGIYKLAISTFDEYGDLIGAHLETLAAKRELEKLIRHLERECALLEGRPVADGWMVEEAA